MSSKKKAQKLAEQATGEVAAITLKVVENVTNEVIRETINATNERNRPDIESPPEQVSSEQVVELAKERIYRELIPPLRNILIELAVSSTTNYIMRKVSALFRRWS